MSSWPPVSTHLHLTVCLQTFENESDRFSEKIGWACVFVAKFRRHPELFFKSSIQGSNTLQSPEPDLLSDDYESGAFEEAESSSEASSSSKASSSSEG